MSKVVTTGPRCTHPPRQDTSTFPRYYSTISRMWTSGVSGTRLRCTGRRDKDMWKLGGGCSAAART